MVTIDELYEELKCFKDCTIAEFEDIFTSKANSKLPLFANLYILREQYNYYSMTEMAANKYTYPMVIGMNTAWYYFLRRKLPTRTTQFTSIPRSAALMLLWNIGSYSLYYSPQIRNKYRINLNHLFDLDRSFLYDN